MFLLNPEAGLFFCIRILLTLKNESEFTIATIHYKFYFADEVVDVVVIVVIIAPRDILL